MYPKTQACIAEKLNQGVFPGVAYQFIEQRQQETVVLGNAALFPVTEKLTREHLFDVASLTKVICTTTVVLKNYEKGLLSMDDPLQRYLPAFLDSQVTLRHLLTHTSDIQTFIPNRDQLGCEELKQAYLGVRAGKDIGKTIRYTDTGMILLGFMLEAIYQKPLADVFKEEVLFPLEMLASDFSTTDKKVAATQRLADGEILSGEVHDPKARILGIHAGNAGLFSTIDDISKFAQMYLNYGKGPKGQFLKDQTIRLLLKDQAATKNGQRSFGWDFMKEQTCLFHTGYTGTFLIVDLKKQSAFIFLSNRVHPKDNRKSYLFHRDQLLKTYLKEKAQGTFSCYNNQE